MEPAVTYRPGRHPQDTEDLALEFMEQEVGRHDWKANWPKFKANQGDEAAVLRKVQAWLNYMGIEYDPREIVQFLDQMVEKRNGIWR